MFSLDTVQLDPMRLYVLLPTLMLHQKGQKTYVPANRIRILCLMVVDKICEVIAIF